MSIQELEITIDDRMLDQYDEYDTVEGLVRAAIADFDGETSQKEDESKFGAGKRFDRGYNS